MCQTKVFSTSGFHSDNDDDILLKWRYPFDQHEPVETKISNHGQFIEYSFNLKYSSLIYFNKHTFELGVLDEELAQAGDSG